jgi:hypothetical protein
MAFFYKKYGVALVKEEARITQDQNPKGMGTPQ